MSDDFANDPKRLKDSGNDDVKALLAAYVAPRGPSELDLEAIRSGVSAAAKNGLGVKGSGAKGAVTPGALGVKIAGGLTALALAAAAVVVRSNMLGSTDDTRPIASATLPTPSYETVAPASSVGSPLVPPTASPIESAAAATASAKNELKTVGAPTWSARPKAPKIEEVVGVASVKEPTGDTLAKESALIQSARSEIEANPNVALAKLAEHRTSFGKGELAPEREYLTIRALYRVGRKEEATKLAESYDTRFPGSPYQRAVASLVEKNR